MMIEIPLWLVALVGLLLVAGSLVMMFWQRRKKPKSVPLPTEWALTGRAVFTTGERRVYRMLRETLPNHVILSKLPLVRFCQPIDLTQLRYWYDILGSNYVSFAICAPNGRVLAAIDIDKDRAGDANPHLRRSMKIKRAVLRSCRVRYLRTPAGKLPSAAEIHALLPKAGTSANSPSEPLAGPGAVAAAKAAAAQAAAHIARQAVASAASALPANTAATATEAPGATQVETPPVEAPASEHANAQPTEDLASELSNTSAKTGSEAESEADHAEPIRIQVADAAPAEAMSRARQSLASTVASRRAQRNILWQESNVFQDSFFALDSRLDDLGMEEPTVSGDLDPLSPSTLKEPLENAAVETIDTLDAARTLDPPAVVKVTLDDMVPSERLSKAAVADIEEARYAPSHPN